MDLSDKDHDGGDELWSSVAPETGSVLTRGQARAWALVLDSRSIPCCIEPAGAGWLLLAPEQHRESARRELRLYEEANLDWPPALPATRQRIKNTLPTVSVLLLLATFHNLTLIGLSLPGHGVLDLYELGAAHAARIRAGE